MALTNAETAVLVAATGVFFTVLTYLGMRRRDLRAESKADTDKARQEGVDKASLNGVVEDMARIMTTELPRLQRIEILTETNAVQIKSLAELEKKRSDSLERILDHLEKKG